MELLEDYDALARRGRLDLGVPEAITRNLSTKIALRPYQVQAVARFRDYMEDDAVRAAPVQLLFEMATGSGKTAVMAALILDLYERGYRNFLFFVNSTQIVEKTRANFIDPAASKFLFAQDVRIGDARVELRSVSNFDEARPDAINIHFTTIQGLHARMLRPRENDMTPEDFEDNRVVLISDEAHHMSAETRAVERLSQGEAEARASWEGTVREIMARNPENVLLEFTATADLENPVIREKYNQRLIYRYDLRAFRADGYSKDIELRQAALPPEERMLQAAVLSQYRRKVAEGHGLRCKPVILMKSRKIADSKENEVLFHDLIAKLDGARIRALRDASADDPTLSRAFDLVLDERGLSPDDFAQELRLDFAPEKVVNVNDPKGLEERQILLNTLEDWDNEIRVIFAVDKLNEGWDVLNLFDIVRLYDTRDGRGERVGRTTMSEAQLIGRGARYFPFVAPDEEDAPRDRRKFDRDVDSPLRALEELHYHCSHNPRYIDDIKRALRNVGLRDDDDDERVTLRVKDSFKRTEVYQSGYLWSNSRRPNLREGVEGLADYMPNRSLEYPALLSGRVVETGAFDAGPGTDTGAGDRITRTLRLPELGADALRFAMDGLPFFRFDALVDLFPRLSGRDAFVSEEVYLGGVSVTLRGERARVSDLSAADRVDVARFCLRQVEATIRSSRVDHEGTREFRPELIRNVLTDRSLKVGALGEASRSWNNTQLDDMDHIDLHAEDWHVFDDSYGTDQEKLLIRFIHDNRDRLRERFEEFYLIRNEKMVTIYAFADGRAFEPDFLLLLRRPRAEVFSTIQVFIEPKMRKLIPEERWKSDFLEQIVEHHQLPMIYQDSGHAIWGLPFFNSEDGATMSRFSDAFEGLVDA